MPKTLPKLNRVKRKKRGSTKRKLKDKETFSILRQMLTHSGLP